MISNGVMAIFCVISLRAVAFGTNYIRLNEVGTHSVCDKNVAEKFQLFVLNRS